MLMQITSYLYQEYLSLIQQMKDFQLPSPPAQIWTQTLPTFPLGEPIPPNERKSWKPRPSCCKNTFVLGLIT